VTYQVALMYLVAGIGLALGVALLLRLRDPALGEERIYAFRMAGIMLAALGLVLGMSATAMWSWSVKG
jgi:hypothetical protein